jgi:hypothetical protein
MKSRSSTGVGQKIDLDYNIETMRITDPGEEAGPVNTFQKPSILNSIKTQSRMTQAISIDIDQTDSDSSDQPAKISADVQSAKLRQLLGKIKASN